MDTNKNKEVKQPQFVKCCSLVNFKKIVKKKLPNNDHSSPLIRYVVIQTGQCTYNLFTSFISYTRTLFFKIAKWKNVFCYDL